MKTNNHTSFNAAAALACVLGTAITASLLIAALEAFPEARRALLIGLVLLVLAIAAAVSLAASPPAPPAPSTGHQPSLPDNALPSGWPFSPHSDSSTEGADYLHQLRLARSQGYEAARADAMHVTQTPNPHTPGGPAHHSWATSYQAQGGSLGGPATPEKTHVPAKNA